MLVGVDDRLGRAKDESGAGSVWTRRGGEAPLASSVSSSSQTALIRRLPMERRPTDCELLELDRRFIARRWRSGEGAGDTAADAICNWAGSGSDRCFSLLRCCGFRFRCGEAGADKGLCCCFCVAGSTSQRTCFAQSSPLYARIDCLFFPLRFALLLLLLRAELAE